MKLTCPSCGSQFDDKDWLRLHKDARHSKQFEHKPRGMQGGRKAAFRTNPSSAWIRATKPAGSLEDHYRPKD